MRTAINLYTLRSVEAPSSEILHSIASAGYAGVEFAGLSDPETVADALEGTDLAVAGAHVPIDDLENEFEATVERYRTIGCRDLVVPYLPEEAFASEDAVTRTAARLDALADRASDEGFSFHYHNHDHEFTDLGTETGFEAFCDRSERVGIELDSGWAVAAGADPVALLERYADRVRLVHAKDVERGSGTPVELGEGDLPLEGVLAEADRSRVEWAVYEHDEPTDPIESMRHGVGLLDRS
ncbi:sugar phosphate isomerase/epimerase family protein [Natronorarus salvus]|uniref:sugar phosphate isomerase/epimerase family protein n=1 Tax=Natronorarus salvus TaxID=3117733 RepID=UPI002F26B07F